MSVGKGRKGKKGKIENGNTDEMVIQVSRLAVCVAVQRYLCVTPHLFVVDVDFLDAVCGGHSFDCVFG